jgi:class 3 adenylate cyclase
MSRPLDELLDAALRAERLGRFSEARDLLREAVGGDGQLALDASLRLGKLSIYSGQDYFAEAETVLTAAYEQARRIGAPRQTAMAAHLLAELERHRGRFDVAAKWLDSSPALSQDAAPGPEVGQLLHCRGLLAANRGDLANAERLFFRAHQAYQEIGELQGLAEVFNSVANLLLRRGHSRTALAFARRALELRQKLGDRYGEAMDWGVIGRARLLRAEYDEARAAFTKSLDISRELGTKRGIGMMLNHLGDVALLEKDLPAAAAFHQRSLAEDPGLINGVMAWYGLARVYFAVGQAEKAAAAADEMDARLKQAPSANAMTDALLGLRGAVAWRRGDFAEGEKLLEQAAKVLGQREYPLHTVHALYELRDLHQKQLRVPAAVRVMGRALDVLSECGAERGVRDAEEWLRTVDSPALTRLALQRHLPGPVVERILAGRLGDAKGGKQEVTVLFCDIRDYTTLSEGLQPEEIVELLNEWFAEATRAVRRHGGVVDKFIGDAVMALFGVPDPHREAASDAVRAALAFRDALAALNLRHRALGAPEIRIGIGIHTGEAVVGLIGSHMHQSYTAIGDVVNTASRLEGLCKEHHCDIVISSEVQKTQDRQAVAETAFLGKAKVKGKQEEVGVWRVLGLRTAPAKSRPASG